MEYCAGCHGTDGKGGDKAASLAITLSVMTRSDSELEQIVRDGTTEGMPPFGQIGDANIHAIVGYLHAMEGSSASASAGAVVVTGDVTCRAKSVFWQSAMRRLSQDQRGRRIHRL